MPDAATPPSRIHPLALRLAMLLPVVLLVLLALHSVERAGTWYFLLLAGAACSFAISSRTEIPGLRGLSRLPGSDRPLVWIVLAALLVIGYLQNLITWVPDGQFFRPSDISIWKTELVLVMALMGPFVHGCLSRILRLLPPVSSRRLAEEFALYVNFSGIAMVLWTGYAGMSVGGIAAAVVLIVLAELTLHATA